MDMASFNKVRIIRGPEALLYGSNTIGGVINVSRQVSLDSRFQKPSYWTVFGLETSNKSYFGNLIAYFPFKQNQQFKFSFLKRDTGDQITPVGSLDNTALSNMEWTGSYAYFGSSFRSNLSIEHIQMDYGIPGTLEGHINGVDIDMEKTTQKFQYHRDISFLGFHVLDVDQRFIQYEHSEFESSSTYPAVKMNQQIFSLHNKLIGPEVTLGSSFQFRDFKAGGFYWTPNTMEISGAIFGLIEKEFNPFILQLSSRAEYLGVIPETSSLFISNLEKDQIQQKEFFILTSGVGLLYHRAHWKYSLSLMNTGRAPSIENLYSDGPHLGSYAYEIGQPNLGLEKTFGIESSLKYHKNKTEISFTGYHNYSPNYHLSSKLGDGYEPGADWIEWGSGSSGWLYIYQMKGLKTSIYGFESELNYALTQQIKVAGSYAVTRGQNLSDGIPLAYMPPDKMIFSTEWDLSHLSLVATFKHVLPQERLGEFETRTDGYSVMDLNGSYTIHASRITHKIIFQFDNILNEKYYNHLSRIKQIMPEKGRGFGLQYRMIF